MTVGYLHESAHAGSERCRRRLLPPCRVTNSGEEILLAQGLPIDDDQGMVEVDMLEVCEGCLHVFYFSNWQHAK